MHVLFFLSTNGKWVPWTSAPTLWIAGNCFSVGFYLSSLLLFFLAPSLLLFFLALMASSLLLFLYFSWLLLFICFSWLLWRVNRSNLTVYSAVNAIKTECHYYQTWLLVLPKHRKLAGNAALICYPPTPSAQGLTVDVNIPVCTPEVNPLAMFVAQQHILVYFTTKCATDDLTASLFRDAVLSPLAN